MIAFGDNNMNQVTREAHDTFLNSKVSNYGGPTKSFVPGGQSNGQGNSKAAPIDDSHFLDMLFGSACRKDCIKKLGGKGAGLKDCIRDCKGKGITKSKSKEIDLAQQAKLQDILSSSLKDSGEEKSNTGVWVVVALVVIVLFGGIVFMMNRHKTKTATA